MIMMQFHLVYLIQWDSSHVGYNSCMRSQLSSNAHYPLSLCLWFPLEYSYVAQTREGIVNDSSSDIDFLPESSPLELLRV